MKKRMKKRMKSGKISGKINRRPQKRRPQKRRTQKRRTQKRRTQKRRTQRRRQNLKGGWVCDKHTEEGDMWFYEYCPKCRIAAESEAARRTLAALRASREASQAKHEQPHLGEKEPTGVQLTPTERAAALLKRGSSLEVPLLTQSDSTAGAED